MSRTLTDWLNWQETLHLSEIELGLERIGKVARKMGLMQPPFTVITVAGTNGKGSCVALLESILRKQGFKTGTYTSPHLLRYNERIALNGEAAKDSIICDAFESIDTAREQTSLTYFEFGTLAAMTCFFRQQVDVAILEVGLGGRLDATNVWDADLAIITGIAIDHVSWLGDNRESIAIEKAGIMRCGKPVVCGDPDPPATIADEARRKKAHLFQLGQHYSYKPNGEDHWEWCWLTSMQSDKHCRIYPKPALSGHFQLNNAATVVTGLHLLDQQLPVTEQSIRQGLRSVTLPGRLQLLSTNPHWLIDVAHNPQSAEQLAHYLIQNPVSGDQPALFSMLEDKDIEQVVQLMKSLINEWHLVELSGNRSLTNRQLSDRLKKAGVTAEIHCHANFEAACQTLRKQAKNEDRVVAFGSFLLVSGVLKTCGF